jgi:hypothetical protein
MKFAAALLMTPVSGPLSRQMVSMAESTMSACRTSTACT